MILAERQQGWLVDDGVVISVGHDVFFAEPAETDDMESPTEPGFIGGVWLDQLTVAAVPGDGFGETLDDGFAPGPGPDFTRGRIDGIAVGADDKGITTDGNAGADFGQHICLGEEIGGVVMDQSTTPLDL